MRLDDKRALRKELIQLLEACQDGSEEVSVRARELTATHKGQVALLDEDLARAIQLLEDVAYASSPVDKQRIKDVLVALRLASR